MTRIAALLGLKSFLLVLACAAQCSAEQPPPSTTEFFFAPADLNSLKAGAWLEYECEWKCGDQTRTWKERMACVRATETEVWIECARLPGRTELFRVERKSRKVKAAWEMKRDGTISKMEVNELPQLPVPEMVTTVEVTKATTESGTYQVGSQKLDTVKVHIEADCKKGGSKFRKKLSLSLSSNLPLQMPSQGDTRLAPPLDTLSQLAPAAKWKEAPKLEGTVVKYVVIQEDPAGIELAITDSAELTGFGSDAKPSVKVEGETDK